MRVLVGLALAALCGCAPLSSDFRAEMRIRSANSGWALGYIGGSGMHVIPLDGGSPAGENLENYSGPCRSCLGWFSSDGKLIIWQLTWPDWKPTEPSLLIRTVSGQTVSTWFGQINTVAALALSPDRSKVAIEAQNYFPGAPYTGLQYVILGTPQRIFLDPQPPETEASGTGSVGWSPDSRKIVFSRHGRIIVIDIATGKREEIASGSNPAWSPDGRWISFLSPDMHPMLLDPSNRHEAILFSGRRVTGPIAWSPDSCCVSFSERGRNIADIVTLSETRMVVYRIRDGQWFPLARFGLMGGSSNGFRWFYNYKTFLEVNRANQAKQKEEEAPARR